MAGANRADREVIAGIDTHKDTHTAAALSATGRLLGTRTFSADGHGYGELLEWLRSHGEVLRAGVEGTGAYGSGLAAYLSEQGVICIEVNRPNRQARRRHGKSDPADAEAAARATLSGDAVGIPKAQNGLVEAMRILRLERRSAIRARTQCANQIHAVVLTAPDTLRKGLRNLSMVALVAHAGRYRKNAVTDSATATRRVLKGLARRWLQLSREVAELDAELKTLVTNAAPDLVRVYGVGVDVASTLLVAAGDNPTRLVSEAAFAAMCGVNPVDASSGRQHRHRLNRGGNRDANRALWVVALVRYRTDPRTRRYAERRASEGLSRLEIIRCLKRYIAREIYRVILNSIPEKCPADGRAVAA